MTKNVGHNNRIKAAIKASHKRPFFKSSLNGTDLELLVYSDIGESWDGKGVTALDIKSQLDKAGSISGITLRLNSPGGDCFEGIAIYNLLRAAKVPITTCVDGVAASAASIIACAGDKRIIGINAMIMIHNAWSVGLGNSTELRKLADTLDKVSGSIAATYVDRTGLSADTVKQMMNEETWMNAQDALANGFATEIAESDESAVNMAKTFKALKRYKATPATLKADDDDDITTDMPCLCQCPDCMGDDCGACSGEDCDDENCCDCPMQNEFEDSNLSQYEARLRLLTLTAI